MFLLVAEKGLSFRGRVGFCHPLLSILCRQGSLSVHDTNTESVYAVFVSQTNIKYLTNLVQSVKLRHLYAYHNQFRWIKDRRYDIILNHFQ